MTIPLGRQFSLLTGGYRKCALIPTSCLWHIEHHHRWWWGPHPCPFHNHITYLLPWSILGTKLSKTHSWAVKPVEWNTQSKLGKHTLLSRMLVGLFCHWTNPKTESCYLWFYEKYAGQALFLECNTKVKPSRHFCSKFHNILSTNHKQKLLIPRGCIW